MTSGGVKKELEGILNDPQATYTHVDKTDLAACLLEFARLIDKRNALIHAHPVTDHDGSQILNYQARTDRPLPDMKMRVDQHGVGASGGSRSPSRSAAQKAGAIG